MNLQHAKNNPGKFHEMRATATKFDVKQGDYGEYALGTLKDEMGTMEKVLFAVKTGDVLPNISSAQKLGVWGVRYDANTGKFKAYYNRAVAKQLQGQQGTQNRPQSTNAPKQGRGNVEIRKSVVCAYIAAGAAGAQMLVEEIEYWMEYISTGVDASLPDNKTDEGHGQDGMCSYCHLPIENCSCQAY